MPDGNRDDDGGGNIFTHTLTTREGLTRRAAVPYDRLRARLR
jgi:hypothetical protein